MRDVVVTFPLWFALTGALAEVVSLYFKKVRNPLMLLSPDYVWMAPLALLALIVAIVMLMHLLAGRSRSRTIEGLRLFVPISLVAFNLLMLAPRLAHYAAAILAAGIAVQLSRVILAHRDSTAGIVRRTAVWILGGLIAGGALIGTALSRNPPSTSVTPSANAGINVVLITLDTVRAANLSLYGYSRQTTPNLERLAKWGVAFDNAFSTAPWTLPSHASMFTGRWPHELSVDGETPLDATYPTLAEYLRGRGYATGGFVANLKYCGASTGLDRGFERYEDYARSVGDAVASSTLLRTVADNFRIRRLVANDEHLNRVPAAEISRRALDWISAQNDQPFFAFLNYFDAHEPYLPPAPFDRQFGPGRSRGRHSPLHHWLWNPAVRHQPFGDDVRQEEIDAYDGAIAHLDAEVGRFVDELDRRGLMDRTLLVITADHGEEFAEHGVYEHGYSLYRPSVHVPLIVIEPLARNRRETFLQVNVSAPVSLHDLAATITDIAQLNDGSPFPPTSFARLWQGIGFFMPSLPPTSLLSEVGPSTGQPDWFPSSKGEMKSVVYQGMRYIRNGDGTEELYEMDPSHDPWERRNLAALPEHQQDLVGARALLQRVLNGGS